jgi:hypothetical protein
MEGTNWERGLEPSGKERHGKEFSGTSALIGETQINIHYWLWVRAGWLTA